MPSFAQQFWIVAGLTFCCAAALFLALRTRRRKHEITKFAAPHLLPLLTANVSPARRRLKNILLLLGLASLFLALARPQWGSRWVELRRKGIDMFIAVDVSKSMLAPDMKPSRLERVKLAVRDFTARLDGGDRIGLLPFAGTSFLRVPLTTDYDSFNTVLDSISIETIRKPGTKIGPVIEEAAQLLSGELNHKILILLTDGEDLNEDEGGLRRALDFAAQEKMLIYTVGAGTAQGELIPLPQGGFVQDKNGVFVTSRLNEQVLTAIADATGGSYAPLGSMGEGLISLYERRLSLLRKDVQEGRKKKMPLERFQWPLAAAILLLSADFLLIGRRRTLRLPSIFTAGRRKKKMPAAAVLLLCFAAARPAWADQGGELYRAGRHREAEAWYQQELAKDSGNAVLHFNLGASLHQQGRHLEAAESFTKALRSDDVALQAKSYFNRGISLHHAGAKEGQAGVLQGAVEHLKQAEQSFAAAASLLSDPTKKAKAARYQQLANSERQQIEKRIQEEQKKSNSGEKDTGKNKTQQDQTDSKDRQEKERSSRPNQQDNSENKLQDSPSEGVEKRIQEEQEKAGGGAKDRENKTQHNQTGNKERHPEQIKAEDVQKTTPHDKSGTKLQDSPSDAGEEKNGSSGTAGGQRPVMPEQLPAGQQNSKGERSMGSRMTEEEARFLLDSLKSEQGELNFIPQEAADQTGGKDW